MGGSISHRALLDLLGKLALHSPFDRFQDVVTDPLGRVTWDRALLEDTRLHEDRKPIGIATALGFVEFIGAANIGLWRIANEVHGIRGPVDAVVVLAPLTEQSSCKLERPQLGLAEGNRRQLLARDGLEERLERGAQRAHSDPAVLV